MEAFVAQELHELPPTEGPLGRLGFWTRTLSRLFWNGVVVRIEGRRRTPGNRGERPADIRHPGFGMTEGLVAAARVLRGSIRSLLRAPAYSLTTVATLGLGLGAFTWIFSVVHPVLLAPLPFPDPDRLVAAYERSPGPEGRAGWVSPVTYRDWEEQSEALEGLAHWRLNLWTWSGDGGPRILRGYAVSHEFLGVLGVDMELGRGFTPEEDQPGGPGVVILTRAFWAQSFGSDPEVLGATMTLDGAPYTIVGVAGATGEFPGAGDYFVPAALDLAREFRDFRYLGVIGRMRDGVSVEEAQRDLDRVAQAVARAHPNTNEGWGGELRLLKEDRVAWVRPILMAMSVAVGLLLLVALGNVTNLSLARSAGRTGDAATRRALGASRGHVARIFVVESLALAVLGGGVGLALAWSGMKGFGGLILHRLPAGTEMAVSASSAAFALGCAVLVGLLLGLLSFALAGSGSRDRSRTINARWGTAVRGTNRFREGVLVLQVGMALSLLVGATLLTRSLTALGRVDVGFDPRGIVTFSYDLPRAGYGEEEVIRAFQRDLLARVGAVPGVQAVGLVTPLPMEMGSTPSSWTLEPGISSPEVSTVMAHMRTASPGYAEAMGIRLVSGHFFRPEGGEDSEPVTVVVNRTFADRYMAGSDPLGARITWGEADAPESDWPTIVGVVEDVRFRSLRSEGEPEIYLAASQLPSTWGYLVVRSPRPARDVAQAARAALAAVDPTIPFGDVRTGEEMMSRQLATSRFSTLLAALFAGVATVLALVGIIGVLSIVVAQRMREMGIRVALGAAPPAISRLVLLRGMLPVGLGLLLGVGLASFGTRLLASQVYGVGLLDPVSILLPLGVLGSVGLLACFVPARRASAADPVSLLRAE
jgi:predicted permease